MLAKMNQTYVFLDPDGKEDAGMCVLVPARTGIVYGNQCGGTSCEILQKEGYIIPVGSSDIESEIYEFFQKHFGCNGYHPHIKWDEGMLRELGLLVSRIPCWYCQLNGDDNRLMLELDVNRINECIEAWIPVKTSVISGYLLTKNSD